MIAEGELLAGKYRVESLLGEGGMGYVVSAIHEQLEQRVAVKLLVPELAQDQDAAERFLREARSAVKIQSEHVARVLDVGQLSDGAPYMVMEFLSGRDLSQELAARQRFDIGSAIDYLLQACEAVAEAHVLGVIHRDLKPANLFLSRRADGSPLVKVLDFGISKAMQADGSGPQSPSLTAAQSLLGSPAYMSPEQARRPKTVDARTDIWSLGIILYEFLAGQTPFPGDAPLEVLTAAVSDPIPDLGLVRPDVPRELEAVIAKCLEKKPEDRFQSVADFARALAPFASASSMPSISRISGILRPSTAPQEAVSATMRSSGTPRPEPSSDVVLELRPVTPRAISERSISEKDTQMDWGKSQSGARRSRRRIALAAFATLALFALFAFGLFKANGDHSSPVSSGAPHAEEIPAAAQPPRALEVSKELSPGVAPGAVVTVTPTPATAEPNPSPPTASASASARPVKVHPVRKSQPVPKPVAKAVEEEDTEDPLEERR